MNERRTPGHLIVSSLMVFLIGVAACAPALVATEGMAGPEIAVEKFKPTGISFQPLVKYKRLVLTVSGPGDLILRREFEAGKPVSFNLLDKTGKPLPDGQYKYELRVVPVVDPRVRKKMAAARELEDRSRVEAELRKGGWLPERPLVQSGSFSIANGTMVDRGRKESEEPIRRGKGSKP